MFASFLDIGWWIGLWLVLWLDTAKENDENEQDFDAESNTFTGHLKRLLSLENAGSIFLAVVVIFVRGCDTEQNSDNERDNDENCPREERGPIIERASLQKREHEEHEENEERHGDTSFLGWVEYIKRTAPLIGAAQFLDRRIYILVGEKAKEGENKPIR